MGDGRGEAFSVAQQLRNAAWSCTSALVRKAATRMPAESTRAWRLMLSIFLAPLNQCGPATGGALTDDESTTTALGRLRRLDRMRASPRITVSTLVQVPARHRRGKCLCAVDQLTGKSCGWGYHPLARECRRAHPVCSTHRMARRYSRQRLGGHALPAVGMVRHDEAGDPRPGGVGQVGSIPAQTRWSWVT